MKKKEKKIFYCFDCYHNITYWSLTLFLICLVVIISLEVGKPNIWSISCGLLAFLLVIIAYRQQLQFTDKSLKKNSVWPKKRRDIPYTSIEGVQWKQGMCIIYLQDKSMLSIHLWPKEKERLIESFQAKGIKVENK